MSQLSIAVIFNIEKLANKQFSQKRNVTNAFFLISVIGGKKTNL